jgi:hypothetical protein
MTVSTFITALLLASAPPVPDYSKSESWAARPDKDDSADIAPLGVSAIDQDKAAVDVFFIHPTSYFGLDLNAAIDDATVNHRTDTGSIANQASVFNGCCRVFAPRYRQAALSTYISRRESVAEEAWSLAYSDVKQAFDYYVQHENGGRPFIIASHSQGSRYALWLLQDRIEGTPLRDRFVAAYIIGYGIPADWFTRNLKTIGVCKAANDTGCVLNWSTFGEGGNPDRIRTKEMCRYGDKFESNAGKALVCTNPLSWTTTSDQADKSLNLGAWAVIEGKTGAPKPNFAGAHCDNGALFVDSISDPTFRIPALPGENYHMVDYQLFYMNIRANAVARANAFVAAHPKAPATPKTTATPTTSTKPAVPASKP